MRSRVWIALGLAALGACGAPEEEVVEAPLVPRRSQAMADSAQMARANDALAREVYAYGGGARDPFESLLATAAVGPELPDLSLVAIYVDHSDTDRSVAVLRERITGKRYNLHAGDRIGRLRVASIRERDVDFIVDDFGTERRETLSLRRPQEEETP